MPPGPAEPPAGGGPEAALRQVRALLREFQESADPARRAEVGQRAAALWWRLDDAGLCGGSPAEPWEQALLALAAWHTADDRLRRQRASDAEVAGLLARLEA